MYRWLAGALVLLVAGLVFQLGLLAFSMYVLLLILPLSWWLTRCWMEHLDAARVNRDVQLEIGDRVAVELRIRNRWFGPVAWVLAEDHLPEHALRQRPPRLHVQGKPVRAGPIGRSKSLVLKYEITFAMRGYYQIGPLVLETGDVFGLHRRWRIAAAPFFVQVNPRIVPLSGYQIASRRPVGEIRLTHRLYEDPTRMAGVRQYQNGDPLNRVHWRATARTGLLHAKQYDPSCIAGATILLDFHARSYPARGEPYRSELAVTAAASIAHAVFHLGQQIGLVTNGRDAADRIRLEGWDKEFRSRQQAHRQVDMHPQSDRLRPLVIETRRGAEQMSRILDVLARVELTDGLTFAQLAGEVAGRMPRDATVIAILGSVDMETSLALDLLKHQGFAVTAVLVGLTEQELETAYGLLAAYRIQMLHARDEASLTELCNLMLMR
ncbi:MAG: DUF58 domain-containing protein [Gemmataceae bacterium]